ncbi:hypothetical protein DFS33DRAFT_1098461 [Desarmillaria ectypa]|nr:hypothetical protein DFS33DRAFT_1098461 [Desarmillaria ectypa]
MHRIMVVERNYAHGFYINKGGYGYVYRCPLHGQQGRNKNFKIFVHFSGFFHRQTWDLRHHILLQQGANHNVISYNAIEEPWQSYNDMAFHASYAYFNLIEVSPLVQFTQKALLQRVPGKYFLRRLCRQFVHILDFERGGRILNNDVDMMTLIKMISTPRVLGTSGFATKCKIAYSPQTRRKIRQLSVTLFTTT